MATWAEIAANMAGQWASTSPGTSTRPPPSMTRTPDSADTGSAAVGPTGSIVVPRTTTSLGPISAGLRPSKTRTPERR
jgi:hypothetical protein